MGRRTPEPELAGRFHPRRIALPPCSAQLNTIEGDFWVRLLYTHPAHWSDELIETIAECDKVAKYVDIPLQHISDRMLTAMKRETNGDYIRDLLRRMRAGIPGLGIRTTFIVGFPGETEEDFDELLEFIREFRFERAGVFQYSKEEGTRAYKMDGHLHHMTRKSRWSRAMAELAEDRRRNQPGAGRQGKSACSSSNPASPAPSGTPRKSTAPCMVDETLPVGEFADSHDRRLARLRPGGGEVGPRERSPGSAGLQTGSQGSQAD